MARFDGMTTYRVGLHCKTSIAVDPRGYWDKGYTPPVDEFGYYQPDKNMDCDEYRIANARLIAVAPDLLDVLLDILQDHANCEVSTLKRDKALAVITKAIGSTT